MPTGTEETDDEALQLAWTSDKWHHVADEKNFFWKVQTDLKKTSVRDAVHQTSHL